MLKQILTKFSKFIAILVILFSGTNLIPVQAQNNTPQTIETEQYTGELTNKDNSKLTITKDGKANQYNIVNDIKIKRDGTSSSLDKLQAGDMLLVTQNKNSKELLAVDVVSKGIIDNTTLVIGSLIALLFLAGIVLYFVRKTSQGTIRTMNSN